VILVGGFLHGGGVEERVRTWSATGAG
jgi:hypothetical protein